MFAELYSQPQCNFRTLLAPWEVMSGCLYSLPGNIGPGLKFSIQNLKTVASCPLTSWQIDGEKWKQWHFIFLGSKITVDGDWSYEIKRRLLLGRKAMTTLESVLKSRDIILLTKVCLVKDTVFPEVMYRCESWTRKKAEHQRFDAFKLWCWRRFLRALWIARRSNQSVLKEIGPKYSLKD